MDLSFTDEDLRFRAEVRDFIAHNYPAELRGKSHGQGELTKEDYLAWHRVLHKRGWIAPAWPKSYGGPGWNATQRYIFSEELAAAETMPIMPFGTSMVGPVIYTFGNETQKAFYLPRILSGEHWWCQGYSEPGAGSDLASLRTRAVRDGDHYIVNGGKTWTTMAQFADWMFCLVRTDPNAKPQSGISFLLIDMKTPGITIRPIVTMDGGHEVNEVFLEDVRVPAANLVGKENEGWTYAKFLLTHERSGIAAISRSKKAIEHLKAVARAETVDGTPLIQAPEFRGKLAELEIDLTALEYTELRALARESAGGGLGPESSILKIKGTDIQQRISELVVEAVGIHAFPYAEQSGQLGHNTGPIGPDYALGAAQTYFNLRKTSIYGGTNEIQRNIIAKMVLGL